MDLREKTGKVVWRARCNRRGRRKAESRQGDASAMSERMRGSMDQHQEDRGQQQPKPLDDAEVRRRRTELHNLSSGADSVIAERRRAQERLRELNAEHADRLQAASELTAWLQNVMREVSRISEERQTSADQIQRLDTDILQLAKKCRTLTRQLRRAVGQDVCPDCGSKDTTEISYGLIERGPYADLFDPDFVAGGCSLNMDESVYCFHCGKRFLGNMGEWYRTKARSEKGE